MSKVVITNANALREAINKTRNLSFWNRNLNAVLVAAYEVHFEKPESSKITVAISEAKSTAEYLRKLVMEIEAAIVFSVKPGVESKVVEQGEKH